MKIYIESTDHRIAACDGKWWDYGFHTYGFTYAHGRLQDKAGFDLLAIRDEDGPTLDAADMVADVTAVLPDGGEVAARLFHWRVNSQHPHCTGLLVALDDADAMAYAKAKFTARRDFP